MAVAGLHNVPAFAPSFFYESESYGSRPGTRASTVLQMWRELEGDHVVSHSYRSRQKESSVSDCVSTTTSIGQGSDHGDDISQHSDSYENRGFTGSEIEHEDNNSVVSEQSIDLGESERERVRRTFEEWMKSGSKGQSSYGLNLNNRSGKWLGENECERVRIIREWVQMSTSQERNNCGSPRDGGAEVGSQIEQVRDGLVITHQEIGARKPIRKLCGRQTLLDLLLRAQSERKRELLSLSEQKPVSDFAHRNRIQALLRGRFLRNKRSVPDEKPSSVAATELSLLRQRTVSDLREGFLSKLDSPASTSVRSAEFDISSSDGNNDDSDSTIREDEITEIYTASDLRGTLDGNMNAQDIEVQVTEAEEAEDLGLDNDIREQDVPLSAESASEGTVLETEVRHQEVLPNVEYNGSIHGEENHITVTNESLVFDINYIVSPQVNNDDDERRGVSDDREIDGRTTDLEINANAESDPQDASPQPVHETEYSAVAFTDDSIGNVTRNWQETFANQIFSEPSDSNIEEQYQMEESHNDWPSHAFQEAIDSWLDMPSIDIGRSVGRIDTWEDDDSVQTVELRELFSRRRVSSLLRSGFRESLDQVLQSHMERLVHVSGDWEMDNMSSFPALVEQDEDRLNGDQDLSLSNAAERNPIGVASSTHFASSQPPWDEQFQRASWTHHISNQQSGMEWDIINELRIDMARLQQRMDNMQNMLEACMDMQIELQRSIRQEVSSALNRSIFSREDADASEENRVHDESQWDHVRKGVCCVCRNSKIDSLLYRCGHMCTCSKCAENLVQYKGKCPLCRAPAVEVVRAYFIH